MDDLERIGASTGECCSDEAEEADVFTNLGLNSLGSGRIVILHLTVRLDHYHSDE